MAGHKAADKTAPQATPNILRDCLAGRNDCRSVGVGTEASIPRLLSEPSGNNRGIMAPAPFVDPRGGGAEVDLKAQVCQDVGAGQEMGTSIRDV